MLPTSRRPKLERVICRTNWAIDYNKSFRRANTIINNDIYIDALRHLQQQKKDFKQPICPEDLAKQHFSGKYAPV